MIPRVGGKPVDESCRNQIPTLVCVGRISRQKDPQFLAQALQNVGSPVRCIWVGDGEAQLRQVLEDAGVYVTGWVTSREAHDHISSADLFVHSAEWEGAPMTLVDAAALGVPILVRGIPHLDGLGFAKGGTTPRELGSSIQRFFSEPDYRTQVSGQAIESLSVHSSGAQRRALAALYQETKEIRSE
ncbi:glycosyltransferase [Rhodococcus sp. SGAir0479]|uniref:glycosyltransferase n=1 Tax=Rhodococcus sp. SGAir0479 TaxID=2567884 RepID=UPI0015869724|nr:glycosyltransferase [Rhodococcus sp. SGAir0479]